MINEAVADLAWLAERGALAGVAEIIAERRRQIGKGYTPGHDRGQYPDGTLVSGVIAEAHLTEQEILHGVAGPDAAQQHMARSGALAAAEIDRLAAGSGG